MVSDSASSPRSDSVKGLQTTPPNETKRARWNSPIEFTITCIGYAVGLGNFWRFPYLCYSNGGGAFLVPYTLVLVFIGIPLFILELGVGQKAQIGATHAWAKIHPALAGIGYAGTSATFMVALYYNVIVAWAIWFLVHSFTSPLPWSEPNLGNATPANHSLMNATIAGAALNFFEVDTLHCRGERPTCSWKGVDDWTLVQPSLFDAGGIVAPLVPCLAVGWFLIWLCVCKGIESLGRVAWFTAIFPYIVLTILLIRGLTLPGAEIGLKFYLEPNFEKLLDIQVWIAAASQIFYSTGVGWGTLVAFASYNDHQHNFVRDAWLVPLINCGTSFLAGLVVFSVLGFMANEAGVSVEELEMEGSGLAFVAYPQAIAQMPGAPFFAILFFVMVICLGVDSQFAMVETVRTPQAGTAPSMRKFTPAPLPKPQLTECLSLCAHQVLTALNDAGAMAALSKPAKAGIVCSAMGLIGLTFVTRAGMHWLELFDSFAVNMTLFLCGALECLAMGWVYGIDRFASDTLAMANSKLPKALLALYKIPIPGVLGTLAISTLYSSLSSGYDFPAGGIAVGWIISCISMSPLVAFAARHYLRLVRSRRGITRPRAKPKSQLPKEVEMSSDVTLQAMGIRTCQNEGKGSAVSPASPCASGEVRGVHDPGLPSNGATPSKAASTCEAGIV